MIVSMTGFGKGRAGNKNISVEAEVKSVNSRYLDISLRVPSSLMNKDFDIKEFVKIKVKRGKVSVIIQIKRNGLEEDNLVLDTDKLNHIYRFSNPLKRPARFRKKLNSSIF
jgi:uncharacterized protein (TIGR00255 family)